MFASILINALISGSVYAILAFGFSLIFGVAKILNLAHTSFYLITGFLVFIGINLFKINFSIVYILAVIGTGILGILCYKLCFDRVKTHELTVMIISLALALMFQEIFILMFKVQLRRIPPFIPGFVEIAGVRVLYQHLFAVGTILLILIVTWILLSKTRLGNAIRAVSQDNEAANLVGINVSRINMIAMVLSAVLAGVGGLVIAPILMVHPLMWINPLVIVLSAVVLGGLGSLRGSVIAAYILGFAETFVTFLVPGGSFLRGAISLAVMVAVLLIRPEGLFGVVFEEERL